MHYKLLGFSQSGSVRRFAFERIGIGEPTVHLTVLADTVLVRKYNLSLQELPSLCSRLLEKAGNDQPAATLSLSEAHLSTYAAESAAAKAEEAAKRALRSQHAANAMASRTGKSSAHASTGNLTPATAVNS